MSENMEVQTVRKMPKWGWAGWIVLLAQLIGVSLAGDTSGDLKLAPQAIVVAVLAFTAGVAGIAVMLSRRSP